MVERCILQDPAQFNSITFNNSSVDNTFILYDSPVAIIVLINTNFPYFVEFPWRLSFLSTPGCDFFL